MIFIQTVLSIIRQLFTFKAVYLPFLAVATIATLIVVLRVISIKH